MTQRLRTAATLLLVAAVGGCSPADSPLGNADDLSIDPPNVLLVLGSPDSTRALVAYLRAGNGSETVATGVAWSVLDTAVARVSPTGLISARAVGTTSVRATLPNLVASSTVNVQAAGSPAAPFFVEDFEDLEYGARGWYDNGAFTTTTTNPASGSRALVAHFPVGANIASWGAGRVQFTPTDSLYVSFYARYSGNWVGSGQAYHPHEFFILTTENPAYAAPAWTRLTVYIEHNHRTGGGFPVLGWQDGQNVDVSRIGQNLVGVTEARAVAGCNGNPDGITSSCFSVGSQQWNWKYLIGSRPVFSDTAGATSKTAWHHVEALFVMNSIANGQAVSDGTARYWIDGVLQMEATNVQFRTGARPTQRFNQLMVSPYIGDGSPVEQTMWIDRIVLARRRP